MTSSLSLSSRPSSEPVPVEPVSGEPVLTEQERIGHDANRFFRSLHWGDQSPTVVPDPKKLKYSASKERMARLKVLGYRSSKPPIDTLEGLADFEASLRDKYLAREKSKERDKEIRAKYASELAKDGTNLIAAASKVRVKAEVLKGLVGEACLPDPRYYNQWLQEQKASMRTEAELSFTPEEEEAIQGYFYAKTLRRVGNPWDRTLKLLKDKSKLQKLLGKKDPLSAPLEIPELEIPVLVPLPSISTLPPRDRTAYQWQFVQDTMEVEDSLDYLAARTAVLRVPFGSAGIGAAQEVNHLEAEVFALFETYIAEKHKRPMQINAFMKTSQLGVEYLQFATKIFSSEESVALYLRQTVRAFKKDKEEGVDMYHSAGHHLDKDEHEIFKNHRYFDTKVKAIIDQIVDRDNRAGEKKPSPKREESKEAPSLDAPKQGQKRKAEAPKTAEAPKGEKQLKTAQK